VDMVYLPEHRRKKNSIVSRSAMACGMGFFLIVVKVNGALDDLDEQHQLWFRH
jgi:hypothetical protein